MIIAMVTGSYPPDTCGVGDYTYRLSEALRTMNENVEIITHRRWNASDAPLLAKHIDSLEPDIIHIQYPTIGFGRNLAPQVLNLMRPCVVTLHEVSQSHLLRKLSLVPFYLHAKHLIFTNTNECEYARSWNASISGRSTVIPLGSYISSAAPAGIRDVSEIVHFGLARPNKGLEEVIALAELIGLQNLPYHIRIITKPHPQQLDYYYILRKRTNTLPVIWNIDLPDHEVAALLSRAAVGYLPYPDGVSERRTSLLALLANGVATITTRGYQTPPSMCDIAEFARDPGHALYLVRTLVDNDEKRINLAKRGYDYAKQFTWDKIAKAHLDVYNKLVARNTISKK